MPIGPPEGLAGNTARALWAQPFSQCPPLIVRCCMGQWDCVPAPRHWLHLLLEPQGGRVLRPYTGVGVKWLWNSLIDLRT